MPSPNDGTSILSLGEDNRRGVMPVEGLPSERPAGSGSLDAFIGVASSRSHQQQTRPADERYFSVRWMLERERAREASDDCSSAFAIIPVGELMAAVGCPLPNRAQTFGFVSGTDSHLLFA